MNNLELERMTKMSKLKFEPTIIKEWNDEREAFGVLAEDEESSTAGLK